MIKEIDFLPSWYKSGRRNRISCRTQYAAIFCIFLVMLIWDLSFSYSISRTKAEYMQAESAQEQAEKIIDEFAEIKNQVSSLRSKVEVLDSIDSRINVPAIIAELSYLVGERVILSRVYMNAEAFQEPDGINSVRIGKKQADQDGIFYGNVQCRLTIRGIAADSSEVAQLICNIEESPYFFRVIPSFSKNRSMERFEALKDRESEAASASEFEIKCYLANFIQLADGGIQETIK